ncbi:uncharacterized protein LOC122370009 isoform X7 [Amphibalanus amphitrite]|uniref:uncharacterized protein LOC122370009 isoform X7 n=1 Tax=Amphibalanus amphitrite TaxID=1232801 RepID=UPI001C904D2C|nr:uncharacterized protein LOC122370009 isoform X7 [Amphibalanus amphitrite]
MVSNQQQTRDPVLSAVLRFTREGWPSGDLVMPELVQYRSKEAENTMELLRKSFAYFGIPRTLVSDNATCFTAPAFETFCKQLGMRHLLTAPLSAKSNGLAERCVQTVKQGLRKQKHGSMDTKICRFLFAYRTSPHSTTAQTPAELMMGRRLRTRMDCLLPDLQDRVSAAQQQMKERYDRRSQDRVLTPGMRVWVSQVSGLAGVGRGTRWLPGHCVSRSGSKITVRLEDGRVIQRHLDFVVPSGSSRQMELTDEPTPSMPPGWMQPPPPGTPLSEEGRGRLAAPAERDPAAGGPPGTRAASAAPLPSPPPSADPGTTQPGDAETPPPSPPRPPSAAQCTTQPQPDDPPRRYNLRPRPILRK